MRGGGGGGVGAVNIRGRGGVVQTRESPDFRSPEVGRYVTAALLIHVPPTSCDVISFYGQGQLVFVV